MRCVGVIVLWLIVYGCSAQFGIRAQYGLSDATNWEQLVQQTRQFTDTRFFGSGYTIGVDYWLRLPQNRIEFYPEIRYSRYKTSAQLIALSQDIEVNSSSLGLVLNTHFYFLDFFGDCDCPTFSKRGGLVKKGFFLSLHPGVYYHKKSSDFALGQLDSVSPQIGIGAGLDIGVSNLITVSPTIQYSFGFNDTLDGAAALISVPEFQNLESATFRQFLFGLRVGLRPDYKN